MSVPLTIFTVPKAFTGEFTRIQTNAVRSWKALGVEEIILLGDDAGAADFCEREQVTWGGAIARNDYGTPLLNEVFELGEAIAQTELVAYVNADIILFDDFLMAVEECVKALPHFMMSGQRGDVEDIPALQFAGLDISAAVYRWLKGLATPKGDAALDYFVYRKGDLGEIPPFAIGRFRWDNWLAWRALSRGLAFVDATEAVFAAHQNHAPSVRVEGDAERVMNDLLVGTGGGRLCRLSDATHRLTADYRIVEVERA